MKINTSIFIIMDVFTSIFNLQYAFYLVMKQCGWQNSETVPHNPYSLVSTPLWKSYLWSMSRSCNMLVLKEKKILFNLPERKTVHDKGEKCTSTNWTTLQHACNIQDWVGLTLGVVTATQKPNPLSHHICTSGLAWAGSQSPASEPGTGTRCNCLNP